ncbi:phage tail terminator protein [Marinobacterium litorale]|uniref:phage tail terminator protein n=1 Tax=Marinobacterium litorale TaxID=404770 RepID=UPI0003FCFF8E|nr:hypothetical protein [Marinobacterium litorale]
MLELKDDYLAAEPILVTTLEQVADIRKVYRSEDLATLDERSQICPALHLIYWGDSIPLQSQGGVVGHVTQTWIVVLAIDLRKKDKAGGLLADLIKTMSGVHTELGSIKRVNAPAKPSFRGGFGYYPLAFELTFRTKGARK